jgi:hypothetical protein
MAIVTSVGHDSIQLDSDTLIVVYPSCTLTQVKIMDGRLAGRQAGLRVLLPTHIFVIITTTTTAATVASTTTVITATPAATAITITATTVQL